MNKIEELRSELNNFKEEFEKKIDKLEKEEQDWKPQYGEEYWFYDKDMEGIRIKNWLDFSVDNTHLRNKVIFRTEEEAQRYADYQEAKREYSHEFTKEEWEDNDIYKYCIYYNYTDKKITIGSHRFIRNTEQTFFKSKEQAQEFIDKYKAEILEFEFGIKE